MKKIYFSLILILIATIIAHSQNIGIADEEFIPDKSAALEIKSTNKGLLIPRMTYIERNNIVEPAPSLLIYQTNNTPGYYYFDGSKWQSFANDNNDNDSDPTNELQTISIKNDTIFLEHDGYVVLPIVSTNRIENGAITTDKILDNQVTSSKLNNMNASVDQFLQFNGTAWIPATISGGLEYKGTWDAIANLPVLADGSGNNGDYYIVAISGTQNLGSGERFYNIGDWVLYNGQTWQVINNSNEVSSVFGRKGEVIASYGDYSWNLIDLSGSSLNDLSDVNVIAPASGHFLIRDGSTWISQTISGDISIIGSTGTAQLNSKVVEYSNLQDAAGAANTILNWNGSSWQEVSFSILEGDASTTNELQDLSLSGDTLRLTNDATPVSLAAFANTDAQDLSLSDNTLSLTGDATTVDLSAFVNTDSQDLTLAGNTLSLTNDASPVSLAAFANTDAQDLSLSDNTLSLTGDATPVDLSAFVNTDNQDLTLTGNTLSLTNDASPVSLAAFINTDAQDLSLSENTLSLTGDATPVDLSAFVNTDNQNLTGSLTSTILTINIDNGTSAIVDLADLTSDSFSGEFSELLNIPSGLSDGDDNTQLSEAEVDAYVSNNGYLTTEIDNSITNELITSVTYDDVSNTLSITDPGNTYNVDLTDATPSDNRLKENLEPTHYGIQDLMKIKVYDFDFISGDKNQTGFIAQDLHKIYPLAVKVGGEDAHINPWLINYGHITPLLTVSIQELYQKIEVIENENEYLRTEILNLEKKLAAISDYETRIENLELQLHKIILESEELAESRK